jgi:predicted ATPase
MKNLYLIDIKLKSTPVQLSFINSIFPITLSQNITVIAGENGSGKSTLLEGIAVKLGCNAEGGGKNFNFSTEPTHSALHQHLQLSKGHKKEKDLFFYRAETFYNLNSEIRRMDEVSSFDPEIKTYYGGRDLHTLSHGEAMEALYQNRFKPNGLYILDEPEASLSPTRQLSFIIRIVELARQGSQFIIATHSPILMSIPGCDLRLIEDNRLKPITPEETEAFGIYKAVLNSQGRYLQKLVSEIE